MRRVLILGGTSEASALARRLAATSGIATTLSLAGRTRAPAAQPVPVRIGGFGGVEGLRRWLYANAIDRVIDATHPFAAQMTANAFAACASEGVPRVRFTRPPWQDRLGDRWTHVSNIEAAVRALGASVRRVFLPLGRNSLGAFAAAPQNYYLVRSIDPPDSLAYLPVHKIVLGRPPFALEAESALLRDHRIDVMVAKNAGGDASAAKLTAAREMELPVIMVAPPPLPPGLVLHELDAALAFARDG